jgi:Beta-ketoacyl synthase, N-terminal domain
LATVHANDDRAQDPDSSHSVLAMNKTPAPIAIIGMACRLPGGIDSPDQLWDALLRGDDFITEIPPDRCDADEYYDPEPGVGESDLALAGGVTVMLEPRRFVSASAQGMVSPTGRCHAFDVAADGFVSAEGCVVVLLKRLVDALRDRDRILAVVRGTAANQDGRSATITTPSLDAPPPYPSHADGHYPFWRRLARLLIHGGSTDIITIPGFADHPWLSGEPQPAEGLGDKWSE